MMSSCDYKCLVTEELYIIIAVCVFYHLPNDQNLKLWGDFYSF